MYSDHINKNLKNISESPSGLFMTRCAYSRATKRSLRNIQTKSC